MRLSVSAEDDADCWHYDDKIVIFFNIKEGRLTVGIEPLDELEETIKNAGPSCATLSGDGGALLSKVAHPDHAFIFVHGMLGLVIFRE